MRQSRFSTYKRLQKVDRPLDPPKKRAGQLGVKLHDRVETAHGVGTVVEIAGDRYLIALDGQLAKVWERLASLKRIA